MTGIVSAIRTISTERRTELVRFAKFAAVGAIGAVVDFSILNLGIQAFHLAKWLANTFSFSAAVLSNFTWNRLWTYPESRAEPIGRQLGQFAAVNVVGYLINQVVFLSLDHYVFSEWGTLGYNVSKALAIGVVLFWNYGVNRVWTYRNVK